MLPQKTAQEAQELQPFMFAAWPEVKKTKLKQWLKQGAVFVNEQSITRHDHLVKEGDQISILPNKAPISAKVALPENLVLLYEDAELLVVQKPSNLLTIATEGEQQRTAYALMNRYLKDQAHSGRARVWIVHRLDRETSGVLLFAKTEAAKTKLQSSWHLFEKRYWAVVEGVPKAAQGTLRSHLDESQPHQVFVHAKPGPSTREAITHYRLLRHGTARALVELRLETGRRHQIRVQLAELGHPVVGDVKYGAKSQSARRLALHAVQLRIQHPSTGQDLLFESSFPPELARLLPSEV